MVSNSSEMMRSNTGMGAPATHYPAFRSIKAAKGTTLRWSWLIEYSEKPLHLELSPAISAQRCTKPRTPLYLCRGIDRRIPILSAVCSIWPDGGRFAPAEKPQLW